MVHKDDSVNLSQISSRVSVHLLSLPFSNLGKRALGKKGLRIWSAHFSLLHSVGVSDPKPTVISESFISSSGSHGCMWIAGDCVPSIALLKSFILGWFLFIFIHFIRCYRRKRPWSLFSSSSISRSSLLFVTPNFSQLDSTSPSLYAFSHSGPFVSDVLPLIFRFPNPTILYTQIKWHSYMKSPSHSAKKEKERSDFFIPLNYLPPIICSILTLLTPSILY